MGKKYITGLCFFLFPWLTSPGQITNNRVVIIADLSTFPDTLSTIRSTKANILDLNVSKPYGDASNPNVDSARYVLNKYRAVRKIPYIIWNFSIERSVIISNALFPGYAHLAVPGDSVYIRYDGKDYRYSGKGAMKYQLMYEIAKAKNTINNPFSRIPYRISIQEYLQLDQYYDAQLSEIMPLIETYQSILPSHEYEWIKAFTVIQIEERRLFDFGRIPFENKYVKKLSQIHTPKDQVNVWDTTMYKYWGKWIRSQNFEGTSLDYCEAMAMNEFLRKHNFIQTDTFWPANTNPAILRKFIYYQIKNNPDYKGLFRERALSTYLTEEITQELGAYNWFAQSILKDYYSQPGFPTYKNWIKSLEQSHQYLLDKHNSVPLFELEDMNGTPYGSNNIKGKLAVVHFWYTGCAPCREAADGLARLQDNFKADSNVVFLYVSVDADKKTWLQNKDAGVYVPKGGMQMYTGGLGKKHEMVKDFDATEFPTTRFIDKNNKLVIDYSQPYAKTLPEKSMATLIGQQSLRFKDGPYVFHGEETDTVIYIKNACLSQKINEGNIIVLTDQQDKPLHITLQKQTAIPPAEYPAARKMLVLSDIEGNFTAFSKLLQSNKVIDEKFNWIFDDGHLVFAGDMFDRGEQVTECLWLIYSLEEKAKTAGGMVHFILGNHEIMNLNGDDRYVEDKYKGNYQLMGKTLVEVYNKNSALGRWLRSKNIIEKIGDNLFAHAGISRPVNNMPLTLEQINNLARPYYDRFVSASASADSNLNTLFNSRLSPFWYRSYYRYKEPGQQNIIDSTLQRFNVARIITGHTVVADTISVHYDGKVINTDTRHAAGKSEALLIEDDRYYRVNAIGERIPLFIDDKKQFASTTSPSTHPSK